MISDLVVWGSVGLTLVFVAAWAVSPSLRAHVERPKHQFLEAVEGHERSVRAASAGKEPKPS